ARGSGDVLRAGEVRPAETGDRARAHRRRTRDRQSQLGPSPADLRLGCRVVPSGAANAIGHLRCLRSNANLVPAPVRWPTSGHVTNGTGAWTGTRDVECNLLRLEGDVSRQGLRARTAADSGRRR